MSEPNKTNETKTFDESNERKMLFEVLLEEYQALGIFEKEDIAEVNDERAKLKEEWGILDFEVAEKKDFNERKRQFDLRQKRRYELLKLIRQILHQTPISNPFETFEKYKTLFTRRHGDFDEETFIVAAVLATRKELIDGIITKTPKQSVEICSEANISIRQEKVKASDELKKLKNLEGLGTSHSPTALCFSGGGIRSATFGLGILQSLAKRGLLDKFTYLSSVSGGGYISSWLTAWIKREAEGIEAVQQKLQGKELESGKVEAPEITHLRTFSNYMSPRTGLFTTDTWTLIAVYLRNLLLNWTVIIPLLAAVLLLPKLFVSALDLLDRKMFPLNLGYLEIILQIFPFIGLLGVAAINMLRPSLKEYSYFDQDYRTDEIGKVKSTQKVLRYAIVPTLILAFGVTIYWAYQGKIIPFLLSDGVKVLFTFLDSNIFQNLNFFQWQNSIRAALLARPQMVELMRFSIALFLGGYFLSWLIMLYNYIFHPQQNPPSENECFKENEKFPWAQWSWFRLWFKTYLSEPILSIVTGVLSGALLYLTVENLTPTNYKVELFVCFGVPIFLIVFLLSAAFFTGLAVKITQDDDREWLARFSAVLLKFAVGWSIIASAVVFGPKLFTANQLGENWDSYIKRAGAIFAVISGLFSVLGGFSSKTPANENEPAKDWTSYLIPIASSILAPIFVIFLLISLAYGTQSLVKFTELSHLTWFFILAFIGCLMGLFININKFSFHSTYRERLIRAYLGASNKQRLETANSFTGFNTDQDNLEMKDLVEKNGEKVVVQKPFHVLNMTLNLVKSENLAWQNRKAQSFTVTPLHSGSSNMGKGSGNYRRSECYGYNQQNNKAITLGTALAISGAAASPNMGYFTQSSAVSFLMVLLNVRLGWWLGNPGRRGDTTWKRSAPKWSSKIFFEEALGLTDEIHKYVYLADGGQFENLGLYEMVLRRCKTIIVCDSGSDKEYGFFDLGSAIHKIRVDMGIPIEFVANQKPTKGRNCAIANIKYSEVDECGTENDGTLIYIKPTLDGTQPIDIVQYQSVSPDFPHEGTLDQFYSETQFESYRKLGFNMMETISNNLKMKNLADLIAGAKDYLEKIIEQEKKQKKEKSEQE